MADITPDEQGLFVMPKVDEDDFLPMVSASELAERSAQLAAGDTADLSAAKQATASNYIMPDKLYRVLKWVGLILMPALATLIGAVGPAWGMPKVDAIVLTINALGTFIGVCIGASQVSAMGKPDRSWE